MASDSSKNPHFIPGLSKNKKASHWTSPSHGAVLILVLVTLLALSGLVLHTTEMTSRRFADASHLVLEYKAGLKAESSLHKALELLNLLLRNSQRGWPRGGEALWEEQGVRIAITPCSAKLNLNGLAQKKKVFQRLQQALLEIFRPENISPKEIQNFLYWIGANDSPASVPGTQAMELSSTRRDLNYSPPGRTLIRPEELLLIPGFTHLSPDWIRQRFTVWGQPGRIDLSFASREIILAFLPELAPYWDRIAEFRLDNKLTHPNQLLTEIGLDMDTYSQVLPYLSWETEHFEILIQSREGEWQEVQRYIVQYDLVGAQARPQILARDILHTGY